MQAVDEAASRIATDRDLEREASLLHSQLFGDDASFGEDSRDVVGKLQDAAAGVYDKAAEAKQAEL